MVAGIELPPVLKKIGLAQELSPGPGDKNLGMIDQLGGCLGMSKVAVHDEVDPMNLICEHPLFIGLQSNRLAVSPRTKPACAHRGFSYHTTF